jgi:hypothetical protein
MSFLVVDRPKNTYVFTDDDPREEGYSGQIEEDVSLVEEFPEILEWPGGRPPDRCLGVSHRDETDYRVFPSPIDCRSAGYEPLAARYWTGHSWHEWLEHEG